MKSPESTPRGLTANDGTDKQESPEEADSISHSAGLVLAMHERLAFRHGKRILQSSILDVYMCTVRVKQKSAKLARGGWEGAGQKHLVSHQNRQCQVAGTTLFPHLGRKPNCILTLR